MGLSIVDASAYAMRGLAFAGAPKRAASSLKYAVSATSALIILPKDAEGRLPSLMRLSLSTGAVVYLEVGAEVAVVPTTSVVGGCQVLSGDVIAPWGADRIALVAEASATVTISYIWL